MKFYDDEEIYASLRHFLINRLSAGSCTKRWSKRRQKLKEKCTYER